MNKISRTSVAILAGGRSTRFGSAKANAKIDGVEFGERIIRTLKRAGLTDVSLIGGRHEDASRWGVKFVEDSFVDAGPLGALITAMRASETEILMILPCDVPYIDEQSLEVLGRLTEGCDVRFAKTQSPQWLCSTWRTSVLEVLEQAYSSGERSIHKIAEQLCVEFISLSDDALANINEPHQLEHRTQLGRQVTLTDGD